MKWNVYLSQCIVVLMFAGCHAAKSQQALLPAFDKEGHRGGRGLMPENTIPAMLHALDIGVTTLEMDALITKDEKVILSHDAWFNHIITTKSDGSFLDAKEEKKYSIYGMTYAETQQFDVGMKLNPAFPQQKKVPARKPLLSDVIDSVEQHSGKLKRQLPFYNIETKCKPSTDNVLHPGPEKFVDLLMAVISRKGIAERVIIQSFDFRTLRYLHEKYPSVKTAALVGANDKKTLDEQVKDLGFKPTIYSPEYSIVTKELISSCHQQNIKILPWTVNDKATIELLKSMGVDGIISDYPDLL